MLDEWTGSDHQHAEMLVKRLLDQAGIPAHVERLQTSRALHVRRMMTPAEEAALPVAPQFVTEV